MSDTTIGYGGTPTPNPKGGTPGYAVAPTDPITGDPVSVDPGVPVTTNPGDPGSPGTTIYFARSNHGPEAANVLGLAASAGESPGRAGVFYGPGPLTLPTAKWDAVTGQSGGLTPGAVYYLSATAGKLTTTIPVVGFVTSVGFAIDATTMMVQISAALALA